MESSLSSNYHYGIYSSLVQGIKLPLILNHIIYHSYFYIVFYDFFINQQAAFLSDIMRTWISYNLPVMSVFDARLPPFDKTKIF